MPNTYGLHQFCVATRYFVDGQSVSCNSSPDGKRIAEARPTLDGAEDREQAVIPPGAIPRKSSTVQRRHTLQQWRHDVVHIAGRKAERSGAEEPDPNLGSVSHGRAAR